MPQPRLEDRIDNSPLPLRLNSRAAIFDLRKNEPYVLLLMTEKSTDNSVYWILPGGQLRQGETPFQAVIRELDEEISPLHPDVLPHMSQEYSFDTTAEGKWVHTNLTVYFGRGNSRVDIKGNSNEKEIMGWEWFPLPEAITNLRYAEQKRGVWKLYNQAVEIGLLSPNSNITIFPSSQIVHPQYAGFKMEGSTDYSPRIHGNRTALLPAPNTLPQIKSRS